MKKLRFSIFILSVLLLLTSCIWPQMPIPDNRTEFNPDSNIVMRTVYPVYDSECEKIHITIENCSDEKIEFGSPWYLQRQYGKRWYRVYPDEGVLYFTDILYYLMPGTKRYDSCFMNTYRNSMKKGHYRIVKEINGEWYTAEFEIGDSPITNGTPHGFLPLDQLPADYTPEQAAADGAVVLRQGEIIGGEHMTAFFADWDCYGFSGQLRVMSETEDGWLLTDLIDGEPLITCITRSLRADGVQTVSTRYFGYDHQNNGVLYLSNRRDFTNTDGCVPLFGGYALPQEITDALQSDQHTEDGPLIRAWSPDGKICASVGYQGGLSFSASGWGTVWGGEHAGKTILDLVWQDANTLMVMAEGGEPGLYLYEFFHVEAENWKTIRTISYTYSTHSYVNDEEGNILIPE